MSQTLFADDEVAVDDVVPEVAPTFTAAAPKLRLRLVKQTVRYYSNKGDQCAPTQPTAPLPDPDGSTCTTTGCMTTTGVGGTGTCASYTGECCC
jgi:hypothetical protein